MGCGSDVLLAILSEAFPQSRFEGIEPFSGGFSKFKETNAVVKGSGAKIELCGYEDYPSERKCDLICCVNVFEHVEDWRHFLRWAAERLNEDGLFFVLCPNYSFPYESHFRIPVYWNKGLTYRLHRNHIDDFERNHDSLGL